MKFNQYRDQHNCRSYFVEGKCPPERYKSVGCPFNMQGLWGSKECMYHEGKNMLTSDLDSVTSYTNKDSST